MGQANKGMLMVLDVGLGGSPRSSGNPRLAAGAIFKNEGPYVLEWVAFHRVLGIEHFFIADNNSSDETTVLLAALARAGIVHHLPFPSVPGQPPQPLAYEEILRRHHAEADWIAFLDADEFLLPAPPHRSLPEAIAALDPGPDVGAIAVNWAVYGSSGLKEAAAQPVIERFSRRAEATHPVNRHYKSILRPGAHAGKIQNPHYFPLKPGFRSVHADGAEVTDVPNSSKGLSTRIVWDPIRINHYVIKSWDEFYYRKRARGRAMRSDQLRDETFFNVHDRNEVVDPMPTWLVSATEEECRRIEALLRKSGTAAAEPPGSSFAALRSQLATFLGPSPRAHGAVESVEILGDTALIRGWALTPRKEAAEGFAVAVAERPVQIASLLKTRRGDLIERFPGASSDCGFNLKIPWPHAQEAGRPWVPLTVTARYAANRSFELAAGSANWSTASAAAPAASPKPRAPAIPDRPSMPPEAVAALEEAVKDAACYLEYGSGGSTVLALDLGVPSIISVESDRDWLQAVRRKLASRGRLDHHHLLHVDIGPTKSLGYPVSDEAMRKFQAYPLTPWEFCDARSLAPEVVLIDGRFRVACFLATVLFARPGCRILFDDYQDRPFYHVVRGFAEVGPTFGRMAEFVVPASLDRDGAWIALIRALGDAQ